MILQCPECSTRYLVPDSAIGAGGRTVRCANCRHSWFQGPAGIDPAGAPPPATPPPGISPAPSLPMTSPPVEPAAAPDAAPPAAEQAAPAPEPVAQEPAGSDDAFADRPRFRARRNPVRGWTLAAIAAGLLMLAAIGLISWLGTPGILGRVGLTFAPARSPLLIKDNPIERRELENGSELFAVSGRITNPSGTRQRVPDIRADLRDAQGRLVYNWTITPQQRTLPPGGAVDFNSAKLDVPASSKRLELSFAGEGG